MDKKHFPTDFKSTHTYLVDANTATLHLKRTMRCGTGMENTIMYYVRRSQTLLEQIPKYINHRYPHT